MVDPASGDERHPPPVAELVALALALAPGPGLRPRPLGEGCPVWQPPRVVPPVAPSREGGPPVSLAPCDPGPSLTVPPPVLLAPRRPRWCPPCDDRPAAPPARA